MSYLKTIYLQHLNGASPNATLDANGNMTVTGTVCGASSMMHRNRIINGDMRIDQRNGGNSISNAGGSTSFSVDRWGIFGSQASKFTAQQNAGSVTAPVPFVNYLGITSSSSYTVGASEAFYVRQRVEGMNVGDLLYGTANARTTTLSFWVRSSLTGTFGGSIGEPGANTYYTFSYTIASANTWTYITITIPGYTGGSWNGSNGTNLGLEIIWSLGMGSTNSGSTGSWTTLANAPLSATGAVSVVGTSGATWYITGVQLELGTVATPFEYRHYGDELRLCQRYFIRYNGGRMSPLYKRHDSQVNGVLMLPTSMRTNNPTMTVATTGSFTNFQSVLDSAPASFSGSSENKCTSMNNYYFSCTSTWASTHSFVPSWESFDFSLSSEL